MRFSSSLLALTFALTSFVPASALDVSILRELAELADFGLNADGTPINASATEVSTFSIASEEDDDDDGIVAEYVELPLNHFAENQNYQEEGTFFNRYWVKSNAYRPGGPVFLYDVGEGDAEPYWRGRLESQSSWFRQMVEQFGGIGIVWEHRYYGNSTPGGIDINTPPSVFERLTTAQSLADIDSFAKQFSRKNINATLTPDKTPWVMIGGSYPAVRAAFMRNKYPSTIFAAFASSAPVEARIDMSAYWDPVVRGMRRYGFGNCTNDVIAAIRYIDTQLDQPAKAKALKKQFLGLGAEDADNGDFADTLSFVFTTWQSYGIEGSPYSLRKFCDWIETDPGTTNTSPGGGWRYPGYGNPSPPPPAGNDPSRPRPNPKLAPAEGWARSKGAKWVVDRWATYPYFLAMVNQYIDTNCSGRDDLRGNCRLNYTVTTPAGIAWSWQYCTEWGYFQSANFGPNQIISKYSSLQHWQSVCHRQWPTAPSDLFPAWPNVARTNAQFGGWSIRPSNVYWSGGEFDPWRTLSPMSAESWAPRVKKSATAPGCGVGGKNEDLFGYLLRDAQHCYDFRVGVEEGVRSREIWIKALGKWLECWKAGQGNVQGPGQGQGGKGRPGGGRGRGWRA